MVAGVKFHDDWYSLLRAVYAVIICLLSCLQRNIKLLDTCRKKWIFDSGYRRNVEHSVHTRRQCGHAIMHETADDDRQSSNMNMKMNTRLSIGLSQYWSLCRFCTK